MKKFETLASIRERCQQCKMCINCALYDSKRVVFEDGNPNAQIMIIGQNPGEKEDELGIPFVGPSGQFLDKCLDLAKLSRQNDVYITNAVKCHTVSNQGCKLFCVNSQTSTQVCYKDTGLSAKELRHGRT